MNEQKTDSEEHPEPTKARRLSSSDLMGSQQELIIAHAGEEYRLRLTRQGKLILTK